MKSVARRKWTLVVLTSFSFLGCVPGDEEAQSIDEPEIVLGQQALSALSGFQLRLSGSTRCLDERTFGTTQTATMATCDATVPTQRWGFSGGLFKNGSTGGCLYITSSEGGAAILSSCYGGVNQDFRLYPRLGGTRGTIVTTWFLVNKASSQCLSAGRESQVTQNRSCLSDSAWELVQ